MPSRPNKLEQASHLKYIVMRFSRRDGAIFAERVRTHEGVVERFPTLAAARLRAHILNAQRSPTEFFEGHKEGGR